MAFLWLTNRGFGPEFFHLGWLQPWRLEKQSCEIGSWKASTLGFTVWMQSCLGMFFLIGGLYPQHFSQRGLFCFSTFFVVVFFWFFFGGSNRSSFANFEPRTMVKLGTFCTQKNRRDSIRKTKKSHAAYGGAKGFSISSSWDDPTIQVSRWGCLSNLQGSQRRKWLSFSRYDASIFVASMYIVIAVSKFWEV